MNRIGKNELTLGKHYTLDEMIARIDSVTMEDVDAIIQRMVEKPFAVSMVGASDQAISAFRRDILVPNV